MWSFLKRAIVGNPIPTEKAHHERLSKRIALAVFSSDALSSTAYATEEILRVLAVAVVFGQGHAFTYVIPISVGISILLAVVGMSYRQTIYAYPSGGGAYIVAKENLGTMPGLVAAASLLVDYVLTVSVSVAAGVAAITSAAQGTSFAWVSNHSVAMCLVLIVFIALANLRGVKESGLLFSIPTYAFIFSFVGMIVWGLGRYLMFGATPTPPLEPAIAEGYHPGPLTLMLFLGAFSNGCTALTGIEAISNGIPAFRKPESRNAATTLVWMSITLIGLFLGVSVLAYFYKVVPSEAETVTSQIARQIFSGPMQWFFFFLQAATAAILVLAANTSFADFPRLTSLLARDRFLPRQFANQGDRLVFSNGVVVLAVLSSLLLVMFKGDTHRLIPLYAVGVFVSFTLSQAGMVLHWLRERDQSRVHTAAEATKRERKEKSKDVDTGRLIGDFTEISGWKTSLMINALGAIACAVVLVVFVITKFVHGAWVVCVLIPVIVIMFRGVRRHYDNVADQLVITWKPKLKQRKHTVIVPISGIHNGVIPALEYARSLSKDFKDARAVYISIDPTATAQVKKEWETYADFMPLVILDSPYRSLLKPLMDYIDEVSNENEDTFVTVVLPEFVPARWWHNFLHNQSAILIKAALLFRRGVISVSVPYHLTH